MILTAHQLAMIMPKCASPSGWADALSVAMLGQNFPDDKYVKAEFLAQIAHESHEFTRLEENLNYRAERLMAVWPKRFPTISSATPFAGRPQALAEHVYGGRMGNDPEGSGDGWRYRGRGPIMVTGKDNYRALAEKISDPMLLTCPERLQTRSIGALAAVSFWMSNPKLTRLARNEVSDDDEADFVSISRIINGGKVGLEARRVYRERAIAVLS
jgi:putative chitinase